MSNMGSKSNKLFTEALNPGSYIECPEDSTDEFRQLWEEIVHDYPPDYFRNSHKALVRQYVTAELQLREVSALLESDIEGYVVETPQGTKANPLISTQAALASQVRSCARAIRVAPSAQMQSSQIPKTPARAPTAIAKPGRRRLRIAGVEED